MCSQIETKSYSKITPWWNRREGENKISSLERKREIMCVLSIPLCPMWVRTHCFNFIVTLRGFLNCGVFFAYFNRLFNLLSLNFRSYLYIPNTSLLTDIFSANTFSISSHLFIFLVFVLTSRTLNILLNSNSMR